MGAREVPKTLIHSESAHARVTDWFPVICGQDTHESGIGDAQLQARGLALECQRFRGGNSHANQGTASIALYGAVIAKLALECQHLALECQP